MIFYIIAVFIFIYSLIIDQRKGFFIFIAFNLFLNSNITLISLPGIPILALQDVMILFFCLLTLIKKDNIKPKMSFPWFNPYIFFTLSYILSALFAVAGISSEITASIKSILENISILLLLWRYVEGENDFKYIYKIITVVFFFSCIYGIFEYSIQMNPLTLFEQTLNHDTSKIINNIYVIGASRGYRINSIFFHAIGAGCNWAMYTILTLNIYVKSKDKKIVNCFSLLTAILSIICIILTKQRSPLIFLIVGMLSFIDFKKTQTYILILFGVISLIFIWPYIEPNKDIILSLFDKSKDIGGSSLEMRINQFDAAFELMRTSPFFGLGTKFQQYISNSYTETILGMESIWLTSGLMYGLLGITSNLLLFYYQIIKVPKYFKANRMALIVLGYWATASVTTTPGLNIALYYLILIFFVKTSDKYLSTMETKVEWKFKNGKIIHKKYFT